MPSDNVLGQIRKLVELQKIDAEIYRLKKDLKEKPIYLEEIQEQFEGKKISIKELEDKHKTLQVNRKTQEVELQAREDSIAKANRQLHHRPRRAR